MPPLSWVTDGRALARPDPACLCNGRAPGSCNMDPNTRVAVVLLKAGQLARRYVLCRNHGRQYQRRLNKEDKDARAADAWLQSFLSTPTPQPPTDQEIHEMFLQTTLYQQAEENDKLLDEALTIFEEADAQADAQKAADAKKAAKQLRKAARKQEKSARKAERAATEAACKAQRVEKAAAEAARETRLAIDARETRLAIEEHEEDVHRRSLENEYFLERVLNDASTACVRALPAPSAP